MLASSLRTDIFLTLKTPAAWPVLVICGIFEEIFCKISLTPRLPCPKKRLIKHEICWFRFTFFVFCCNFTVMSKNNGFYLIQAVSFLRNGLFCSDAGKIRDFFQKSMFFKKWQNCRKYSGKLARMKFASFPAFAVNGLNLVDMKVFLQANDFARIPD